MTAEVLEEYPFEESGAPFEIYLLESVIKKEDGITIPAVRELITIISLGRLWKNERLSNKEVVFLRKSAGLKIKNVAKSMGLKEEEVLDYENGAKTMPLLAEKYLRILFFDHIRRNIQNMEDYTLNYFEWLFREWKPTFFDANDPFVFKLRYHKSGWNLLPQE
jgi:DNA-binding transcriptional regulator YiaG